LKKKHVAIKLSDFLQITGTTSQVLTPSKIQKQTRLRIYNTLAIYTNGSETWTVKEQVKARITAVEMKLARKTANYTLYDYKRNQDITDK
jgi:hypothetical protein